VDDVRQATRRDQLPGEAALALARTAAEAIRGLNHATRDQDGPGQPAVAYDILGTLFLAASRLPQLLTQITRSLDQALAAGHLGHDLGHDPAAAIDAAAIFLDDARGSAAALAGDLDAAQQQLAPVNGNPAATRRKDNS
jgi:hypothetical protein